MEKIFAKHMYKGLVPKIWKELLKFNKRKQTTQFKYMQGSEQTPCQRRYTYGQKALAKMLNNFCDSGIEN